MIESIEVLQANSATFALGALAVVIGLGVSLSLTFSGRTASSLFSILLISAAAGYINEFLVVSATPVATVIAQNKKLYPELQDTLFTCEEGRVLMTTKVNVPTGLSSIQITKKIVATNQDCTQPLKVSRKEMALSFLQAVNEQLSPSEQKAFVERNHILVKRLDKNAKPLLTFQ